MDTVHTWSWDQAPDGRGYHCISCGSNWNTHLRKWSRVDTRRHSICRTSEVHWVPVQLSETWFCPYWTEVLFLTRYPYSLTAIQWWWTGHLQAGFLTDILYETPVRGLAEPWWNVGDSSKSSGEHPLSHWILHSSCNQHILCIWHFHTCSVCAAPAIPQRQACEEHTRWHVWVHDQMSFPDRHWRCGVLPRRLLFLAHICRWLNFELFSLTQIILESNVSNWHNKFASSQ